MPDNNDPILMVPANQLAQVIDPAYARVNVTFAGECFDLPDPVPFDATDADVKGWVTETLRAGTPGLPPQPNPDLTDFVVDRFGPNETRPHNQLMVRPKVPFGATT